MLGAFLSLEGFWATLCTEFCWISKRVTQLGYLRKILSFGSFIIESVNHHSLMTKLLVSGSFVIDWIHPMIATWNEFENQAWLDSQLSIRGSESVSQALKQLLAMTDAYDIKLGLREASMAIRHLQLMLAKNACVNLTAIKEPEKALVLHSLDSLLFLKVLQSQNLLLDENQKLLDMGTGGGFPGLTLACCLPCQVTLLDSVGKKVKACSEFADDLLLSDRVQCVHGRLEEYAKVIRCSQDVVVARALAPLDVLLEYAEPYLKRNGYLVFGKGKPDVEELSKAEYVSSLLGYSNVSRETFELPNDMGHREIFVYQKTSRSKVKLPRKNGEARNNPLANR